MRLAQAFRVFFRVLSDAGFAGRVAELERPASTPGTAPVEPKAELTPNRTSSRRNDAVTLLAVLQREGRLVDFLQESIDAYPDAQIGAAVREVHRSCRGVLGRLFDLGPAVATGEGETLRVQAGYDPGRIRLTGQVAGAPPYNGTVVHPGWQAKRCELPEWSGSDDAARVIAPAEVEVR